MDLRHKKQLLEKYWKAETSLSEEKELKNIFSQTDDEVSPYFKSLQDFSEIRTNADFDLKLNRQILQIKKKNRILNIRKWAIAATVTILISSMSFFQYNSYQSKALAKAEARQAFELTKQSLLLFSSELNKGTAYHTFLNEFDETMDKIKMTQQNL